MSHTLAIYLAALVTTAVTGALMAGEISAKEKIDHILLQWRGDEEIRVRLPKSGGLLGQTWTIAVGDQELAFDGFVASMNAHSSNQWRVIRETARVEEDVATIEQELQHPGLKYQTKARFRIWMNPEDKAIRVQIALEGKGQHLDHLGVGRCHGQGLKAKRLYYGTCVINGPIPGFDVGVPRSTNRYWTFELENGLALMQGMDMVPTGFTHEPGDQDALFDVHGYCSSPITYRFVVTRQGAQEAIRQYSRSLRHQPTKALQKLPGRCMLMTWYPLKDHLEWFYREFVGRGAQNFIWLSYTNWPDDENRRLTDESGSLYAAYTNFIDYFDPESEEGRRQSPDWARENCIHNADGKLQRGYHHSTRLLPNLYRKWAVEGTMWDGFFNMRKHVDIMGVNSWYFDVHAAIYPKHYYDHAGEHYTQREFLKHTADMFSLGREMGGDAPVWSEFGNEWFAEHMDGGAFNAQLSPGHFGISDADWQIYPNLDQVHRRWHLPVGAYDATGYSAKAWSDRRSAFQRRVSHNVLLGRAELINCYWPADLSDVASRLMLYYLHSAFHKMLGTHGIHKVEFADDDIHRPIIHYDHGATVWVNLRDDDWEVHGRRLKEFGYLIQGPEFLQYCEVPQGKDFVAEYVQSTDYWLFAAPQTHDFGAAKIRGAYAVRLPERNKIVVYQIKKTEDVISLHLPSILRRPGPYKLRSLATVFEKRRLERVGTKRLSLGDFGLQMGDTYEVHPTKLDGETLVFEPVQDPHALRYEIVVD